MRIETERLILRDWIDADHPHLAAIFADPEVRRYFVDLGTPADANAAIAYFRECQAKLGHSVYAAEHKGDGGLVELVGTVPLRDDIRAVLRGHPTVEIDWQFAKRYWGQGLAPEAARAALDLAWRGPRLTEVVAITAVMNHPSRRVMEKLGMQRDLAGDFDHPNVPLGHVLRPHVLHRIANPLL